MTSFIVETTVFKNIYKFVLVMERQLLATIHVDLKFIFTMYFYLWI